ncbi:TIGR02281 family clan AA aspartic protease [Rhodosalinus sp. 5P4]|uniref:retropepsin-like aspartic protease family protein n=1 Tax=Rhodosalinus sp. 5P4 TaxID=3239196 RepID=UPI0035233F28
MTGDQIAQLTYLALLGGAIAFWLLLRNRTRLGQMAQYAAVWGLIFLGAIAAVGLWGDIRQTVAPRQNVLADQGRITVPRAPDGHYYLTLDVNGVPVRFVVDTGASQVVLTRADAARAGIDTASLAFLGRAMTANGEVATAPVRLDSIGTGPIRDEGFNAWVNAGEMRESLLGMSYLQRFGTIRISDGELVLTR